MLSFYYEKGYDAEEQFKAAIKEMDSETAFKLGKWVANTEALPDRCVQIMCRAHYCSLGFDIRIYHKKSEDAHFDMEKYMVGGLIWSEGIKKWGTHT